MPKHLSFWVTFPGVWFIWQSVFFSVAIDLMLRKIKFLNSFNALIFNYSEIYWCEAQYHFQQQQCCQLLSEIHDHREEGASRTKPIQWISLSIPTSSGRLLGTLRQRSPSILHLCSHSLVSISLVFYKYFCLIAKFFSVFGELKEFSCNTINIWYTASKSCKERNGQERRKRRAPRTSFSSDLCTSTVRDDLPLQWLWP